MNSHNTIIENNVTRFLLFLPAAIFAYIFAYWMMHYMLTLCFGTYAGKSGWFLMEWLASYSSELEKNTEILKHILYCGLRPCAGAFFGIAAGSLLVPKYKLPLSIFLGIAFASYYYLFNYFPSSIFTVNQDGSYVEHPRPAILTALVLLLQFVHLALIVGAVYLFHKESD